VESLVGITAKTSVPPQISAKYVLRPLPRCNALGCFPPAALLEQIDRESRDCVLTLVFEEGLEVELKVPTLALDVLAADQGAAARRMDRSSTV
jgi:hypothetical protein